MRGSFTINGLDTYDTWGIILAPGSVESLLTLPPAKDYIINESRLEDGVRVLSGSTAKAKDGPRELTLEVHLVASSESVFKAKYAAFRAYIKEHRDLEVVIPHSSDIYRLLYRSCTPFSEWNGRVCHIALSVFEPNPSNRSSIIPGPILPT